MRRIRLTYEKGNDERKRKNVTRLLEKESRDDGKRLHKCSGWMDTLDRKRKDMLYFKKNWGGI